MRGMVFGQDADKLIVAATPAEVRQYGVGQPVHVEPQGMTLQQAADVMYRHGFEFNRMEPWIPAPDAYMGDAREITLRTKCGCERKMAVDRRMPTLRVPIFKQVMGVISDHAVECRDFHYAGAQSDRYGNVRLLYVEE